MPTISEDDGRFTCSIIVADYDKRRIHIIGEFGPSGEALRPYEAWLVVGEEWTDGFELDVEHDLEPFYEDTDHYQDKDDWDEDLACFIPQILWGKDQSYESKITDEHRELVKHL
jgi:hypothetical protein